MRLTRQAGRILWGAMALLLALGAHAQEVPMERAQDAFRWLIVVDTSSGMKRRQDATRQTVFNLLKSGFGGYVKPGDVFGVWAFTDEVQEIVQPVASVPGLHDLQMLQVTKQVGALRFRGRQDIGPVMDAINREVARSKDLTIFILTDGEDVVYGTPFDLPIATLFVQHGERLADEHQPFVVTLRSYRGKIEAWAVDAGGGNVTIPPLPPEVEAVRQAREAAEMSEALALSEQAKEQEAQARANLPVRPARPPELSKPIITIISTNQVPPQRSAPEARVNPVTVQSPPISDAPPAPKPVFIKPEVSKPAPKPAEPVVDASPAFPVESGTVPGASEPSASAAAVEQATQVAASGVPPVAPESPKVKPSPPVEPTRVAPVVSTETPSAAQPPVVGTAAPKPEVVAPPPVTEQAATTEQVPPAKATPAEVPAPSTTTVVNESPVVAKPNEAQGETPPTASVAANVAEPVATPTADSPAPASTNTAGAKPPGTLAFPGPTTGKDSPQFLILGLGLLVVAIFLGVFIYFRTRPQGQVSLISQGLDQERGD